MSCTVDTVSSNSLLYSFNLYEIDFSSLWTLTPDIPDVNFPLITFANTLDTEVPVYGAETGLNLKGLYYPSFPNDMQLIEPDLGDYSAKELNKTPGTYSYLISDLDNVFTSTKSITNQITYGIDMVISASQTQEEELEKAWDEAWERGLINPKSSIMYSYFNLMGIKHEMDIRRSEGTHFTSFVDWLNDEQVPDSIQQSLFELDEELTSGPKPWDTEYNYSNEGFEPYKITSVFFGIEKIKYNPDWSCANPYDFAEPWTKYKGTERPRLDTIRANGRLLIPDKITKTASGTFETTAAALSGAGVVQIEVPYGFDVTELIDAPYGQAFDPSLYSEDATPEFPTNWTITPTVASTNWSFDNAYFTVDSATTTTFTLSINVPAKLRKDLLDDPSLGTETITVTWEAIFVAITEFIFPYLESDHFTTLYAACDTENTEKAKYVRGTGIIFDVESFANGENTLQEKLVNCKNDIIDIYENYYEYAANFSKILPYGDIINIHGRYLDAHGSEFFATARQVLRPQEYIENTNDDVEIVNINVILEADEAKACTNGQLYNADNLTSCAEEETNIFQVNQVPVQKSTTSVSLNSKLTKLNGKICPTLPPNFTVKK